MDFELLFEIIRCALSGKPFIKTLTSRQFEEVLKQAEEQAVFGLVFNAVHNAEIVDKENVVGDEVSKAQMAIFEAVGLQEQIKQQNEIVNERAEMLARILAAWGYRTCVLKGQGVAQLYSNPLLRQSGDIDIWVDGKQDEIISCLRSNFIGIRNIDYVHSGAGFFNDVEVEVHFRPSWLYNPFNNRKLQCFFRKHSEEQFTNKQDNVGFVSPTIAFNLVYLIIHINRHVFAEGIGLRQLLDYYYILKHSTEEERNDAYIVLKGLGLKKFIGAIMFIMQEVFTVGQDLLLCPPNKKEGEFLLNEIMRGGNFGKYDDRNEWYDADQRFKRGIFNVKHSLRYLFHYPSEVLWSPFWKLWHWCWRKTKGYL